jgi:hypothetical protein
MNWVQRSDALLVLFLLAQGCGSSSDRPQQRNSATGTSGTSGQRIAWTQAVSNGDDITLYRFALYVDSERYALPYATCRAPQYGVSACESPLPPLKPGRYQLAIVSYRIPDYVDSPRVSAGELVVE